LNSRTYLIELQNIQSYLN